MVSHFPMKGGDSYDYVGRIVSVLSGNYWSYFSDAFCQKIETTTGKTVV